MAASHNGKDVTAIIELRARFDEEANIDWPTRLQEAGVHVMYGVVGYKTHAKMLLVVRRESDGIRRYCHLGTGNYHWKTARAYTDYGLLTANEAIGLDVHEIFLQLTSLTRTPKLRQLLQSPFTMHERVLQMIGDQAQLATGGRHRPHRGAHERTDGAAGDRGAFTTHPAPACRSTWWCGAPARYGPALPECPENIRVRSIIGPLPGTSARMVLWRRT